MHVITALLLLPPLQTEEARAEAITLMGSVANLSTPKNGEILIAATQVGHGLFVGWDPVQLGCVGAEDNQLSLHPHRFVLHTTELDHYATAWPGSEHPAVCHC